MLFKKLKIILFNGGWIPTWELLEVPLESGGFTILYIIERNILTGRRRCFETNMDIAEKEGRADVKEEIRTGRISTKPQRGPK